MDTCANHRVHPAVGLKVLDSERSIFSFPGILEIRALAHSHHDMGLVVKLKEHVTVDALYFSSLFRIEDDDLIATSATEVLGRVDKIGLVRPVWAQLAFDQIGVADPPLLSKQGLVHPLNKTLESFVVNFPAIFKDPCVSSGHSLLIEDRHYQICAILVHIVEAKDATTGSRE
jgi:hypothetical protein